MAGEIRPVSLSNCLYRNPLIPESIRRHVFLPVENYFENNKARFHWVGERSLLVIAEIITGVILQPFGIVATFMGFSLIFDKIDKDLVILRDYYEDREAKDRATDLQGKEKMREAMKKQKEELEKEIEDNILFFVSNSNDDPSYVNKGLMTLFYAALTKNKDTLVDRLMKVYYDYNKLRGFDTTLFHAAVHEERVAIAKLFLDKHPDWINKLDGNHDTPLERAISSCSLPCVRLLLSKKANVNITNRNGNSLLRRVVRCRYIPEIFEIIKLLVNAGANVNELSEEDKRNLEQGDLLNANIHEFYNMIQFGILGTVIIKTCDDDDEYSRKAQIIHLLLEKGAILYPKMGLVYYDIALGGLFRKDNNQKNCLAFLFSQHVLSYYQKELKNKEFYDLFLKKMMEGRSPIGVAWIKNVLNELKEYVYHSSSLKGLCALTIRMQRVAFLDHPAVPAEVKEFVSDFPQIQPSVVDQGLAAGE